MTVLLFSHHPNVVNFDIPAMFTANKMVIYTQKMYVKNGLGRNGLFRGAQSPKIKMSQYWIIFGVRVGEG